MFSSKIAKFFSRLNNRISDFFHFLRRILHFSANFWWIFVRISRQIPEKSDVCRFSIKFAKTISKIAETFEICENYKLFNIIQFYSIVSLIKALPRGQDKEARLAQVESKEDQCVTRYSGDQLTTTVVVRDQREFPTKKDLTLR